MGGEERGRRKRKKKNKRKKETKEERERKNTKEKRIGRWKERTGKDIGGALYYAK